MTNTYLLVLLSFLPCLITSENSYKITPLNKLSGLYYNHLGTAKISSSEFTLLTHFNLSIADQRLEQLKHYYSQSLSLCSHKGTSGASNHVIFYCQNSLRILESKIKQLNEKVEVVTHITGHNLRYKRGIFDGASYALRWLFGIPDADDARYYDKSIKSLINDNKNVQTLMKKQITIISDSIANFNASINALKINEEKLNLNIQLFNNFSEHTESSLNDLKLQSLVAEQISLLTQIAFDLSEFYDLLVSSITLAKHNILHPQVISPLTLLNELSKIILKDGLQWPIPISYEDIHQYFDIIKLSVVYVDKSVIFALKIPLSEDSPYNIYEILPLPMPHNTSNLYSFIEPSFKYILLSTSKVYYVGLQSLEKCSTISPGQYICQETKTTRTQEKPTCETLLLTSPSPKIPASCRTHTISAELEIWHPIHNNQWIFSISNPVQATLTCANSHIVDIQLSSTGIIQLNPGCKAYTPNNILEATQALYLNISNPTPDYNIVLDDCCIKKDTNFTNTPIKIQPIRISNVRLDELKFASHRLKQLEEELQKNSNESPITNQSNWFMSIITTLISILAIFLTYKLLKLLGLFPLLRRFLCLPRKHRNNDSCCLRIFNTNINSPVTPMQLQRIIQEEEALAREEEGFALNNLLPSPATSQRSRPSINMD